MMGWNVSSVMPSLLVLGLVVGLDAGLDVFVQSDHLHVLELLGSGEGTEILLHAVDRAELVHQAGVHHVLGSVELQVIDHAVQIGEGNLTGLADAACGGLPEGVHHGLVLLPVGLADVAGDELLAG